MVLYGFIITSYSLAIASKADEFFQSSSKRRWLTTKKPQTSQLVVFYICKSKILDLNSEITSLLVHLHRLRSQGFHW
ncbi:hypothetical protein SAMN06295967_10378 [Belliella buryatensis]|uniref:Uncharacterized protein n=1 Tax=Belliella buryatensis TaxID=1500549 RepID=A0A239BMJ0_9BACT|nr:hypothetical protein SAMN06295967_10378 [Belliella buryatensis]